MSRNFFPVGLLLFLLSVNTKAAPASPEARADELQTIQAIADEFAARLGIPGQVLIEILGQNKRLVSVHRAHDRNDLFLVCFDQNFLTTLSEEEIRAAVAHEFGHIWIFTHHPYLQTEDLANRTAMQLVPRESLEKVYVKVTQFGGKKQDLKSD